MQTKTALTLACLCASALSAQDVMKVAPGAAKVEFENAQIRVLRFTEQPGAKLAMHSHPAYIDVGFTDSSGRYTFPDGKTEEMKSKAGEVNFSKGVTHTAVNLSKSTDESIMVELKTKPAGVAVNGAGDQLKADPKGTKLVLENEYVRVLRTVVPAHGKLAMHSHPAHVVIYMNGVSARATMADGKTQEANVPARGIRALGATKHVMENLGDTPTEAIVIELKTAEK